MRITFRQLQVFNEVCDLRSYSRAAEEMSLTQPAVSLQIRQLEELIGQPLFDYVGKKLYLTEAAEALKLASRDIFGRLENLDMQLSDRPRKSLDWVRETPSCKSEPNQPKPWQPLETQADRVRFHTDRKQRTPIHSTRPRTIRASDSVYMLSGGPRCC